MKTFRDLITYVNKSLDDTILNNCSFVCCNICKYSEYCYVDSHLLSLDYFYRGEYYG